MKYAEIKSVLIKKKCPPHKVQTEIEKIQAVAKDMSEDTGVPEDKITQMILENVTYVGTTA